MGLNETPSAERVHIGIFGKRNAGKSSLINALTNQDIAIVSGIKGTTTDPVSKAMEILPIGPCMIIDTPGIDDNGELGNMRVKKSYQVLNKTDIALLVVDGTKKSPEDMKLLERIQDKKIPYVVVYNKCDISKDIPCSNNEICVSSLTGKNIRELRELIAAQFQAEDAGKRIVGDLLHPEDIAVLVVPIDSAAPKGRLILPQQQTIRDILEAGAISVVTRETELTATLRTLSKKPALVITDSQAFKQVSKETPEDIRLTSFSILMARYKGELEQVVKSVTTIDTIENGDRILISEGCTHHRQCDDIGTVKLPRWIKSHTGKEPLFEFTSGLGFPEDLSTYKMIVHCGGCMLHEREMKYRLRCAKEQGIPMTNYGILIAYMNGILKRSVEIFPAIAALIR